MPTPPPSGRRPVTPANGRPAAGKNLEIFPPRTPKPRGAVSFVDPVPNSPYPWRVHRATGQAYVVVHGHRHYLGRADLPETVARYHRFAAESMNGAPPVRQDEITVKELVARYWTHAKEYYRKPDGTPTAELPVLRSVLQPLLELYGDTPAKDFGPRALMAVREKMVDRGWTRGSINKHVSRLKGVFKWAAAREMVAGTLCHALDAVSGLRRGRSRARETDPVRPVPVESVESIRPFVSEQVWALIQLQLLSGARPGELVGLRPCDIDRSGKVWVCQLSDHKTAHHGRQRTLYFGPRAQDLLRPYLLRSDQAPLFSPAEAERARRRRAHAARKTPLHYGNFPGSNCVDHPAHPPGEEYDVDAYRRAIARGCDRAFPPPPPLCRRDDETEREYQERLTPEQRAELDAWQVRHRWHPHQLRHTAATLIRREFGLEAAQLTLGHSSAVITDAVYAERDEQKVQQIIQAFG